MTGLFERAEETTAINEALAAAEAGSGRSLMFAGQAGIGKSALALEARAAAAGRGFTVLTSSPTPVSGSLAHGVVRDWVGPLARRTAPGEKPFDGPAETLGRTLASPRAPGWAQHDAWSLNQLDYALGWMLENLCEDAPVLLVVDDVQWADRGSLEVLDLLSARLGASPISLLLGRRTGEAGQSSEIVERLGKRARVLTPAPLSVAGVEQLRLLLAAEGQQSRPDSAEEIHRLTGGIPFLVREVLRSDERLPGQAPRLVVESVKARLTRLGEPALTIARAVALLGDEATFDSVAALCGTTVADLADPLERLADAEFIGLGLWRAWPAHPLVAEAVLGSLTPSERSDHHRRAAEHLTELGMSHQVVASHLVQTLPGENRQVVALLRAAAEESLETGVPEVAATQLLRAVGELRPEDTDPELLRLAAEAHVRAGLVEKALELWAIVRSRATRPEDEARCLADIGDAQMTIGDRKAARASYREARDILSAEGHDRSSQVLRSLLARMGMVDAIYEGAYDEARAIVRTAVGQPQEQDTHADRLIFALAGSALAFDGRDADRARSLARRAVAGGRLLAEETCDGQGLYIATSVLGWTDAFEDALGALDAAVEASRERGSSSGFATASYCRGLVHVRQGNLRRAVADLDAALALRERGWDAYVEAALAGLTFAHVGLGQITEARKLEPELREAAGGASNVIRAFAATAAGLVRASTGNHEDALADYRAAEALTSRQATASAGNPAFVEWRELAVFSLLALNRRAEAHATAQAAVEKARIWGSPRSIGFALRALAATSEPLEAVAHLREAAQLFTSCGAVDQLARARIDLGRLLMRVPGARAEGTALVQQALEYAQEADVPEVARDASRVLVQHGLKVAEPPDSPLRLLTPGERRAVELAATGRTNRQIAQELFVTVKAVEWHLSNAYRKLSISSRAQLPDVLAGQRDPGVFVTPARSSAR